MDPLDKFYVSGFPYPEMRKGQGSAITSVMRSIIEDGKTIHILLAPTGSGKSPIAMAIARGMAAVHSRILGDISNGAPSQLDNFYTNSRRKLANSTTCRTREMPWTVYYNNEITTRYSPERHPRFVFATPKKALQDQYIADFGDNEGVCVLKGKSNYRCGFDPDETADECAARSEKKRDGSGKQMHCFDVHECPYREAVERALVTHPFVILNFHSLQSWLYMAGERELGSKVNYRMLVVDECHLLPSFLIELMSVKLDFERIEKDVEDMLGEDDYPRGYYRNDDVWSSWEDVWKALSQVRERIQLDQITVDVLDTLNASIHVLTRLHDAFSYAEDKKNKYAYQKKIWVLGDVLGGYREVLAGEKTHDQFEFFFDVPKDKPEVLGLHCKSPKEGFAQLAKSFQHIILMSATVSPKAFQEELGAPDSITALHGMAPTIPLSYRPLLLLGDKTTNMKYDNRNAALPIIAENIVKLASLHKGWRGVIHTQSGANCKALQLHIRALLPREPQHNWPPRIGRFIFHHGGNKNPHMVAFMADTSDNSIIVSPSLAEGFDGKEDVARWQCIIKIPYLPRTSGEVKARLQESDGELWYVLETVTALSQMYGRVNRGPTDFGITYLLDGGWNGFRWRMDQVQAWPHVPQVFYEGIAHAGEFFYTYDACGDLIHVPLHQTHPAVKAAKKLLDPKKLLENL